MIQFIEMEKGENCGVESLSPRSRKREFDKCKPDWKKLEEIRDAVASKDAAEMASRETAAAAGVGSDGTAAAGGGTDSAASASSLSAASASFSGKFDLISKREDASVSRSEAKTDASLMSAISNATFGRLDGVAGGLLCDIKPDLKAETASSASSYAGEENNTRVLQQLLQKSNAKESMAKIELKPLRQREDDTSAEVTVKQEPVAAAIESVVDESEKPKPTLLPPPPPETPPPPKKPLVMPPEMKRLLVNKTSGETVLHRAARLGYLVSDILLVFFFFFIISVVL